MIRQNGPLRSCFTLAMPCNHASISCACASLSQCIVSLPWILAKSRASVPLAIDACTAARLKHSARHAANAKWVLFTASTRQHEHKKKSWLHTALMYGGRNQMANSDWVMQVAACQHLPSRPSQTRSL